MNITQQKKANMYLRVFNYLDTHADKLKKITEKTNAFNNFQISVGELLNFDKELNVDDLIIDDKNVKSLKPTLKKQMKNQINDIIAECDRKLSLIDSEMNKLKTSYAAIYSSYRIARKLEDNDNLNILRGWVFDSASGEPLKGVTLKFFENEEVLSCNEITTDGKYVKTSANKGAFSIKSIDKGAYFVQAIKMGYKAQTVVLHVNEGEKNEVAIELEKA